MRALCAGFLHSLRGKRSLLLPLAAAVNRRLDGRFAEIGVLLLAALFLLAAAAVGALADRIFLGPGVVALLFRGDLGFFLVFLVDHKF